MSFVNRKEAELKPNGKTVNTDRKSVKEKLNYVLKNPDRVIARKLASIIGQIIFISFVLGNVCQIMTRHLHLPIIDSTCWDGYIVLDQKYIDELKLWFSNCDILPFRVISLIHKSVERDKHCSKIENVMF
jgi:hypothetical protein